MTIPTDEHVFIAGMTGSGKTLLAEIYLSGNPNPVYKLDVKHETSYRQKKGIPLFYNAHPKEITVCSTIEQVFDSQTHFTIYEPPKSEQNDDYYNEFFDYCFYRRSTQVLVDEAMRITNSFNIPDGYHNILTTGRLFDVTTWSCTQRPAGLNQLILSQSDHVFGFNLTLDADRKRMAGDTGAKEFLEMPLDHNFWYFKQGWLHAKKARLDIQGL